MPMVIMPPSLQSIQTMEPHNLAQAQFRSLRRKEKAAMKAAFPEQLERPLAFGELLATSRLVQADLLPLDFTRIARDEACFRERGLQLRIVVDQGTRDAVTDGASLTRLAAALDVDHDVERRVVIHELERLAHDHASRFAGEEFVDGL